MFTMALYSAIILTTCVLSGTDHDHDHDHEHEHEFSSIWDYCEQKTVCSMPLAVARFAYASGYEPGSGKWYLMGGTVNTSTQFVTSDTVAMIEIPEAPTGETICSELYSPALPQALGQSVGALVDDELYSFGGFNNAFEYLTDIYQSDTTTESNFDDASCELPDPLSAACSVTLGSKVYIMGGLDNGTITDTVYVIDLSADPCTVTELSSMIYTRFAPSCSTNAGKIFVFGGQELGNSSNYYFGADLDSIEIYDIETDTWSLSEATLSYKAHWANAAYLKLEDFNLTLIMGGITGFYGVFDNLDVYDMDEDEIVDSTIMPTGARYAFHSITPPHDGWGSEFVLLAGGKYVVNQKSFIYSSVDRIICDSAAQTYSVMAVAVAMMMAITQ